MINFFNSAMIITPDWLFPQKTKMLLHVRICTDICNISSLGMNGGCHQFVGREKLSVLGPYRNFSMETQIVCCLANSRKTREAGPFSKCYFMQSLLILKVFVT